MSIIPEKNLAIEEEIKNNNAKNVSALNALKEEKIKKLEHNQKPKIYPKRGVIYVFETPNSPQNSIYKIGKTKDLKQRLKSHQSPLSHDINILYFFIYHFF